MSRYYGPHVPLRRSTRAHKKFMVQTPEGRWVHFGQRPYEDWHEHHDPVRRARFRERNARWRRAPKWSPAHLAYWVLW